MPARIMSWWLTISASAGASLSVEMKNCEAFMRVYFPEVDDCGRQQTWRLGLCCA
jgi:hypothetical protein